ncbi:MAG TPA: thiamine-phosphate kinase [Vicinamibacterales bacterium]|nr:thiamine-phosphate kinase [Vicinamibacterales bacterium]
MARLRARTTNRHLRVALGIGDDAAVLTPGRNTHTVVTTDSLVEQVHFRRDWSSAESVGHKALAVNLSDLAAMGSEPEAFLLSLVLPDALPLADFDALIEGALALARASGVELVGGNIARSPGPLIVDVTAIGAIRPRRVLTRAGGRPGDELYVTGWIGRAGAGLAILESGVARAGLTTAEAECLASLERPTPRIRQGLFVSRSRSANACIDLSDGLADGARQLAEASGTGVEIDAAHLPVHPGAARMTPAEALTAAEDYELLFAVSPKRRRGFLAAVSRAGRVPVTLVGRLTKTSSAVLIGPDGPVPLPPGHQHFL